MQGDLGKCEALITFGFFDVVLEHLSSAPSLRRLKAFRGELVSHDPDDEPASLAQERIKAEWKAAPKTSRG